MELNENMRMDLNAGTTDQGRVPSTPEIEGFCRRHHISRFALFGSVLRDDFGPDSDIDVLVEFEPQHVPGLIRLAGIEMELSELWGGRTVDINTPDLLSAYFRPRVLAEAKVLYARG